MKLVSGEDFPANPLPIVITKPSYKPHLLWSMDWFSHYLAIDMGVSYNTGTPQIIHFNHSIGVSLINHRAMGAPPLMETHMSSVQNPSIIPLNPGWFIGIPPWIDL